MKNLKFSRHRHLAWLAGMVLAGSFGSTAQACIDGLANCDPQASVYYYHNNGNNLVQGTSGMVQYNYPLSTIPGPGSDVSSGYVNLATQNMGAYAYASGTSSVPGYNHTYTTLQDSLYIGAGSSGLADGTLVTLQLSLRLDGNWDYNFGDDRARVDVDYWLGITDPGRPVAGEGGDEPEQLLNARVGIWGGINKLGDSYDHEYHSLWDWMSNNGTSDDGFEDYFSGPLPLGVPCTSPNCPGQPIDFDTGTLLIDFNTYVGSSLNLYGNLDLLAQAYDSGSSATINFLNTSALQITSPYANGLDLQYASAVPVPAAVWLFGSGLLGLVGVARRKTGSRAQ